MKDPNSDEQVEAARKWLKQIDPNRDVRLALEAKYPLLSPGQLPPIIPQWDLSADALKHNDIREDLLAGLILHIAEPSAFLSICTYPSDYTTDDLEKRSSSHKLRRVLGHWDSNFALTPPIFHWLDHKLLKLDGHHRTILAFALQATEIPFYCDRSMEGDGIRVYRAAAGNKEGEQVGDGDAEQAAH